LEAFETHGAIDTLYTATGGSGSWLGFPTSDEYVALTGYARSDFEGGYITTTDGTHYTAFPYGCTYSISPTGASLEAVGGGGSVTVTTSTSCPWSVSSNVAWITVVSGGDQIGTGTISYTVAANTSGSPRTGTITVAGKTFTITQQASASSGLNETFEGGTSGWSATGLWHLVSNSNCASPEPGYFSPTHAFYYGKDDSCDYDTGATTSGDLTSPLISGITNESILQFRYFRVVEDFGGGYDNTEVYILSDGGPTKVFSLDSGDPSTSSWATSPQISLAPFAGKQIQIRFRFDSVDAAHNSYPGWFIDDVTVSVPGSSQGPTDQQFLTALYEDILNRPADAGGFSYWMGRLNGGMSREQVAAAFFLSPGFTDGGSFVMRCYYAILGWIPDHDGWRYWYGRLQAGMSKLKMVEVFLSAPAGVANYGSVNNAEFVTLLYQNLLGRTPDAAGHAYWLGRLDSGAITRAQAMLAFIESAAYRELTRKPSQCDMLYIGLLRRTADLAGRSYWLGRLNAGRPLQKVIAVFLTSPGYLGRF